MFFINMIIPWTYPTTFIFLFLSRLGYLLLISFKINLIEVRSDTLGLECWRRHLIIMNIRWVILTWTYVTYASDLYRSILCHLWPNRPLHVVELLIGDPLFIYMRHFNIIINFNLSHLRNSRHLLRLSLNQLFDLLTSHTPMPTISQPPLFFFQTIYLSYRITWTWTYHILILFLESFLITLKGCCPNMPQLYNHIIILFSDGLDYRINNWKTHLVWPWPRFLHQLFYQLWFLTFKGYWTKRCIRLMGFHYIKVNYICIGKLVYEYGRCFYLSFVVAAFMVEVNHRSFYSVAKFDIAALLGILLA